VDNQEEQPKGAPADPIDSDWKPLGGIWRGAMPVASFLIVAASTVSALEAWHRTRLAYGALSPQHVLINLRNWDARLARLMVAQASINLPYAAPEQSGRINRRIDPRSDCYSLGVIFYELLTGALPFEAADPLEWIHAHVARTPLPPHRLHPAVPLALSEIVMKMLEKSPERRYQGMAALAHDLQQCAAQWREHGGIERFALGSADVSARIVAPQSVVGREAELAAMMDAYNAVAAQGAPGLLLVSGYAGIGKSSVVGELEKAVLGRSGVFIAGKFDQYKRNTPYATLGEALRQLVQTLLAGQESAIRSWRRKLGAALEGNAALLFDLIAPLRQLIGEATGQAGEAPAPLPPAEAQPRFFRTLRQFVKVFATAGHPLTILLDDMHWPTRPACAFSTTCWWKRPLPMC
jgi:hypothetical protein